MGRQVRFLLSDEDLLVLAAHLHSVGAVFVPLRGQGPELGSTPSLTGQQISILRDLDAQGAQRVFQPTPLAEPPAPGYWRVDEDRVPVIDFMRGSLNDPRAYGRLHVMTSRWVDGHEVPIDPSFLEWATAIMSWVRRTFRYDRAADLYRGPAVSRRLR